MTITRIQLLLAVLAAALSGQISAAGRTSGFLEHSTEEATAMQQIFQEYLGGITSSFNSSRDVEYVSHLSSSAPAETVVIRFLPDENLEITDAFARVSMDNQQTWFEGECVAIAGGVLDGFRECTIEAVNAVDMVWYIQLSIMTDAGPMVITQTPENSANLFPVPEPLLASLTEEEAGDVEGEGDYLDITGLSASYSNEALFVRFQVAEGGFFEGEFFGPWYLYGAGFSDPEQGLDSDTLVVYSLGFGNGAFGNLVPGLLKLWGTADGEIIGYEYVTEDIVYTIEGNTLQLAVATHYITNDPDFGQWPNSVNGFLVSGLTASTTLDIDFVIFDSTDPGLLIMDTQVQAGNTAPVLSDPLYDNDNLTLMVDYYDDDGNFPLAHSIQVAGLTGMNMNPLSLEFSDHVTWTASSLGLFPGDHTVTFSFSDGSSLVETPFDFTVTALDCDVAGDANNDGALDVLDVVLTVYYILEQLFTNCGDMNADDDVNVQDVVLMVDEIISAD